MVILQARSKLALALLLVGVTVTLLGSSSGHAQYFLKKDNNSGTGDSSLFLKRSVPYPGSDRRGTQEIRPAPVNPQKRNSRPAQPRNERGNAERLPGEAPSIKELQALNPNARPRPRRDIENRWADDVVGSLEFQRMQQESLQRVRNGGGCSSEDIKNVRAFERITEDLADDPSFSSSRSQRFLKFSENPENLRKMVELQARCAGRL